MAMRIVFICIAIFFVIKRLRPTTMITPKMRGSQTEPSMILYADKTAILYYKAIYSPGTCHSRYHM